MFFMLLELNKVVIELLLIVHFLIARGITCRRIAKSDLQKLKPVDAFELRKVLRFLPRTN